MQSEGLGRGKRKKKCEPRGVRIGWLHGEVGGRSVLRESVEVREGLGDGSKKGEFEAAGEKSQFW